MKTLKSDLRSILLFRKAKFHNFSNHNDDGFIYKEIKYTDKSTCNSKVNKIFVKSNYEEFSKNLKYDNLVIASDFDFTLTSKYNSMELENETSVSILTKSKKINDEYKQKYKEIISFYYKIEQSDISKDEKQIIINNIFDNNMEIISNLKLTKNSIKEICEEIGDNIIFRKSLRSFLKGIIKHDIKFIVATAGLKDTAEELLTRDFPIEVKQLKEKKLISVNGNYLTYDKNNVSNGYNNGKIITTWNKHEISFQLEPDFLINRSHFIMIGDHIWDGHCLDGFSNIKQKFKIGLCNITDRELNDGNSDNIDKINNKILSYKKEYDMVIINDECTFDFISLILEKLFI